MSDRPVNDNPPSNIEDISKILEVRKKFSDLDIVVCPACDSEDFGFMPVGKIETDGSVTIHGLICISDICNGETLVEIKKRPNTDK